MGPPVVCWRPHGGELVMSVPESEQIDRVDLDRVAAMTVRPLA